MDNQYTTRLLDEEEDNTEEKPIDEDIADSENIITEKEVEPKRKRKLSKGILFVIAGAILIVIIGSISSIKILENQRSAENEERFWTLTVEENTPLAYAKYLVTFQEGKYMDEANKRLRQLREEEALAWENLKNSTDINDFYSYLSSNPNTPHINRIKFMMDSLSWIATIKDNTADSYKAYIENADLNNITGNYIHLAKERYDYLSQIVLLEGNELDSIKNYVSDIFTTFSSNDTSAIMKIMAPRIVFFDQDTTKSEIIANLEKLYKENKIDSIGYHPQKESLIARKDNAGLLFIDLVVRKETIYDMKIKIGKKTENKREFSLDTLRLRLNSEKQILAIENKAS